MSTLRFIDPGRWDALEAHLNGGTGSERFAFAFTRIVADGEDGPVLCVEDIELIDDGEVEADATGWVLNDQTLDRIHNRAGLQGLGLVEFHSHGIGPPRFSRTDEASLGPMAEYVLNLLGSRPYAAGVWADGVLYAEWFRATDGGVERRTFRSVTVVGDQLRLLNRRSSAVEQRFDRQIPILGAIGQGVIRGMRVAIVGAGGTGSQAILALSYLGIRDFVLLDDDPVEVTNLNRVVTADLADIGAPKTLSARRRILMLDPEATVRIFPGLTPRGEHQELREVDLIVGCADDDGPRHRLNEIAIDAGVPYIDIATGVDPSIEPPATGGRICFVLPGPPCLGCTEELDPGEVGRWYKPEDQRRLDRAHGYGLPEASPSVVHLNGLAVNAAMAEVVAWITGARPPARRLDVDLDVDTDFPGARVTPSRVGVRRPGCVECAGRHPKKLEEGR